MLTDLSKTLLNLHPDEKVILRSSNYLGHRGIEMTVQNSSELIISVIPLIQIATAGYDILSEEMAARILTLRYKKGEQNELHHQSNSQPKVRETTVGTE